MRNLKISKTSYPPKKLEFNEWAMEIRVSKLYDSEVFNDNIVYDEYLRRMKKDTVIINENKNNRLISFFKKLKLNNYNG
jgi:hypothetical protein